MAGRADVLWGDWEGGADQPTNQRDRIYGQGGDDFIYGSHGRNVIFGGAGNDAISVHYGRGFVDCGPGRDIYHVARSRKKALPVPQLREGRLPQRGAARRRSEAAPVGGRGLSGGALRGAARDGRRRPG